MTTYYMMPRAHRQLRRVEPMGFNGGRRVPVDVHADADEYIVTAAVPGMGPEDIEVEILEDVLKLRAEAKEESNGDGEYLLREVPHGTFSRTLRFPDPINAAKVEARIENGVLEIRLPKADEAKAKSIKVKAR